MLILRDSISRLFGEDLKRTPWWADLSTALRKDRWSPDVWASLVSSRSDPK